MRRALAPWLIVVLGCKSSSSPPPPAPEPDPSTPHIVSDVSTWSIQLYWSGGKPPGTTSNTVLQSTGSYRATGRTGNAPEKVCEGNAPPDAMAAVTAALRKTPLTAGFGPRANGSLQIEETITFGDGAHVYAFPSETAAPELRAAYTRAVTAAAAQCTP